MPLPTLSHIGTHTLHEGSYGTTGITMSAEDRMDYLETLQGGAPFGAGSARLGGQVGGALNDYKCGGGRAMDFFMANPAAVAAMHVKVGRGCRLGRLLITRQLPALTPHPLSKTTP